MLILEFEYIFVDFICGMFSLKFGEMSRGGFISPSFKEEESRAIQELNGLFFFVF